MDLSIVEQIFLARNRDQHPDRITSMSVTHNSRDRKRYPKPFFVTDRERERYESGEMDIKTLGVGIFKIHEFYKVAPNKLYSGADIKRLDIDTSSDFLKSQAILKGLEELFRILKIDKEVPDNPEKFQTYDIAHHVGFSIEQEYQLLKLPTEMHRQQFMYDHLVNLLPIVKEMEKLRKKAKMNGHYKNIIPPV